MKIAELAQDRHRRLSGLKAQLVEFLEGHDEEVFAYRDGRLASSLKAKVSSVNFALGMLQRDGFIDKEEVKGRVYFGSHRAIAALRERLGLAAPDPFQRARDIREQVWRRTGDIDVIEVLDSIRGTWE